MTLRTVGVQIGASAVANRRRCVERIRHRGLRRCVRDRGRQQCDVIQRRQFIRRATGLRIGERTIELRSLESERAPRGLGVTFEALRLARKNPVLSAADVTYRAAFQ
jgi:hypothetical protein